MTTFAENRSFNEMLSAAQSVLCAPSAARIAASTPEAACIAASAPEASTQRTTSLCKLAELSQLTVIGTEDGGFAYVAKNAAFPDVIFYSDGCYSEMLQNENFVSYITSLNDLLEHCAKNGTAPQVLNADAQLGHPEGVKPLTTCLWKQNNPYNLLCPFGNDNTSEARTITGCIATAFAQTIYALHKNTGADITLRGAKRYHYTCDNGSKSVASLFFPSLQLNWDKMRDTYNDNSTYEECLAMAQLMYACCVASTISFSTGGSGTHPLFAADGANLFFEGIKSKYVYGLEGHYQEIYDELDANRCVLFNAAAADGGGHAFVGDGYDSQGRVHLNFGWGDGYNGYSTLVSLGGWPNSQSFNTYVPCDPTPYAFCNMQPLAELRDRYCTADFEHPVEVIEENTWYVLYNVGRCNSIYSRAQGSVPQSINYIPAADATASVAPFLVRFTKSGSETYSIQFGTGDYMGALNYNSASGTTSSPSAVFTAGHIGDSRQHWWFKQAGINLDCTYQDGVFGWKTETPTDPMGTNSWMLFPVSLSTERTMTFDYQAAAPTDAVYTLSTYAPGKNYGLMLGNTTSVSKSAKTPILFIPDEEANALDRSRGGVHIVGADDPNLILSAKKSDFKTANGTTNTDTPLTLFLEPTGEPVETGDEALDASSIIVRLRCKTGYLAPQKVGIGSPVYCNMSPASQYARWILTDKAAYDAAIAVGTDRVPASISTTAPRTYDLQGRRLPPNHGVSIQDGKKILNAKK